MPEDEEFGTRKIALCEAVDRCLIYCLTTLSVVGAVGVWRRIL